MNKDERDARAILHLLSGEYCKWCGQHLDVPHACSLDHLHKIQAVLAKASIDWPIGYKVSDLKGECHG